MRVDARSTVRSAAFVVEQQKRRSDTDRIKKITSRIEGSDEEKVVVDTTGLKVVVASETEEESVVVRDSSQIMAVAQNPQASNRCLLTNAGEAHAAMKMGKTIAE